MVCATIRQLLHTLRPQWPSLCIIFVCNFFQPEDGIRAIGVTGVQTCALPISRCVLDPADMPAIFCKDDNRWLLCSNRSEERRVGKEYRCRGRVVDVSCLISDSVILTRLA